MKYHSIRNYLVILLIVIGIAGCNSSNTSDETPPTLVAIATVPTDDTAVNEPPATPIPTDVPTAPTDEPAATDSLDDVSLLSLNAENSYGEPVNVSSYRMALTFEETVTQADGTVVVNAFDIEGERDIVGNKAVFSATATGTADFGTGQSLTFTEVDDRTYFILPTGQCATFSETTPGSDLYGVFLNDGGFLGELEGASIGNPPTELINNVNTTHYIFNETHLPLGAASNEVNSVEGHIYVAQGNEYVVRVVMDGVGQSTLLDNTIEEAVIHYELNYFDFDMPVNITIPDGCTDVTESEYPILEDAFAINALPGIFSYQSNVDMETAVLFYQTEMANAGWAVTQEFDLPTGMMIGYNKDGEDIQITIGPEGEGVTIGILSSP